jgi:autotransporter passenger strand-loop-strand repeat protein
VGSGGFLLVSAGGSAVGAVVGSGGYEVVFGGGVASGTVLESGGILIVLPGGTNVATTSQTGAMVVSTGVVLDKGQSGLTVYPTVADAITVSAANEFVLSAGSTVSNVVSSGANQSIFSGGTASFTTLLGGVEAVGSGGSTTGTVVDSGGDEYVYSAGTATGTIVTSDGELTLYSGGAATGTTVSSGGFEKVSAGGSAVGTIVAASAGLAIGSQGHASSTQVVSGGSEVISIGGTTTGTIVGSAGYQIISSGGVAISAVLEAGAEQSVSGSANYTVVSAGAVETVTSGGVTRSGTVLGGGFEIVSSGGVVIGTTVEAGGILLVLPGGAAVDTSGAVVSTGVLLVQPPAAAVAYASSATGFGIGSAGVAYVLTGGTVSDGTITSGGSVQVFSGGVADGLSLAGGSETVSSGAAAGFTLVSNGGQLVISGTASATLVSKGGTEAVASGGTTDGATVSSGGFELISAGASATSTSVANGGVQLVFSGGVTDAVSVGGGGLQSVNGSATDTHVGSGGAQLVFRGVVSNTVISSGGAEFLFSGGASDQTDLEAGGLLVSLPSTSFSFVSSGGTVVSTGVVVFQASGATVLGSTASNLNLDNGTIAYVLPGGTTISAAISGGGESVYSGGAADATVVGNGGHDSVYSGGAATGTVVTGSGSENVAYGGHAIGTTLGSAGFQVVSYGGSGFDTEVGAGGSATVLQGGTELYTTVDGGYLIVSNGGITVSAVLYNGGTEVDDGDGTISGTDVGAGGDMIFVYSGTVASGLVVAVGGTVDLAYLGYTDSGFSSINNGTLTVTEGSKSFTQLLTGDYSGTYVHLRSDGDTGTVAVFETTPCYCRGTAILTEAGEVAVETLQIGDKVVTLSGAKRPIRWIGRRAYAGRFAAGNRDILPVLIRAGALDKNVPKRDLFVSPLHAMYLDQVLIPAALLVNGHSIVQVETVDRVDYFHIELETHDVILAEGAAAETFIDDDSRMMFHNAMEFSALYPDIVRGDARYCAPRVEAGEALEAVRRRLAARAKAAAKASALGRLTGGLDEVEARRIRGWARDEAVPDLPVVLDIIDNGVTIATLPADRYRMDLALGGIGSGRHGFDIAIPGGLAAGRHLIQVRRSKDGHDLPQSPWLLEVAEEAAETATPVMVKPARFRGCIDSATRQRVIGWAQDEADPTRPVRRLILADGVLVARVAADRYRGDLHEAGIGSGRHGFEVFLPARLSAREAHEIVVKVEQTGLDVSGSPLVIAPSGQFDRDLEEAIAHAVAASAQDGEQQRALSFMLAQADRLRQLAAEAASQRGERLAARQRRRRMGPAGGESDLRRRALVVDGRVPEIGRDAGSAALLSHMHALRRLGYEVSFAAANQMDRASESTAGITRLGAPFYASVEEVLRRQAGCFDLIYLHRADMAERYMAVARHYCPQARILYSVADLHHVRLARQATIENRPELHAASQRLRLIEGMAALSADAVITHSLAEAEALLRLVPGANVHTVGWQVKPWPTPSPFATRHGVAFIGSYAHPPNLDAAYWLIEDVMPRVWRIDPSITCLLVGSDMPDALRRMAGPCVVAMGEVEDLAGEVFDQVRLTVAPLRYGAGIKGKVLDSLAAGIPCVMSDIAAEGLPLSPVLQGLVASNPSDMAALICRMHADEAAQDRAAKAGLSLIRKVFSPAATLRAVQGAIGKPAKESKVA